MRALKALIRFLRGVRDRVLLLVVGFFGPPWQALRRLMTTWRQRIDAAIGKLLQWWANIFKPAHKEKPEEVDPPSPACPLIAAAAVGLAVYTWPAWTWLRERWFIALAVAVWVVALTLARSASRGDSLSRYGRWLREAGRRPGLLYWERFGCLASIGFTVLAVVTGHLRLLPLTIALVAGFIRFLVMTPEERQMRRLGPGPQPVPPLPTDDDSLEDHTFTWPLTIADSTDETTMVVPVSVTIYNKMKADNPTQDWDGDTPRFERWVVNGSTREVDVSAAELRRTSQDRSYSTFKEISNILAFVQSLRYALDKDTTGYDDYWRYPVETIRDEAGDCEDTSILAAAILRRLGHCVAMALLPEHVALGVEAPPGTPGSYAIVDGRRMYFCETTDTGWRVGQMPPDLTGEQVRWLPLPQ